MSDSDSTAEDQETASEKPAEDQKDWRAEAKRWEDRARKNRETLTAERDAAVTEINKRAEKAEQDLATAQREIARLTTAIDHGITAEHLDLLTGNDAEEMAARAKKVSALINNGKAAATPKATEDQKPKEKPAPIVVPSEGKEPPALNSTSLEDAVKRAVGAS